MFSLDEVQKILGIGDKFLTFHIVEKSGEIVISTGVKKDDAGNLVLTDKSKLLETMNGLYDKPCGRKCKK